MKIALVSDIHANQFAFKAVIEEMKKSKIDHVLCLGDLIGYYYGAEQIFNLLDSWEHTVISGNHERMFLDYLKGNETLRKRITTKYGSCFEMYEKSFPQSLVNRIAKFESSKEITLDGLNFLLTHGSPEEKDMYIYPDSSLEILEKYGDLNHDFILMGHTHYPMIFGGKNALIINPGSVGQCRKKGGIARWGLIDTYNTTYVQQDTGYDTSDLIQEMEKGEGKDSYHVKVLKRNINR